MRTVLHWNLLKSILITHKEFGLERITMGNWAEHIKLGLVSALGVTVTLTEINVFIQIGIGLASLAYAVIKTLHAYRDYNRRDNE